MKGFFQSLLGSLAAFILLCLLGIGAFISLIGVIASLAEEPSIEVPAGSVLVLNLNTTIHDTPPSGSLAAIIEATLSDTPQPTTYLLKLLDTIERAKTDDAVAALLLHGNLQAQGYGSGLGAISELRGAIDDFKQSGKPVYAYLVSPSQKDYYLASVATEVWMNPFGLLSINGLATNGPFLGEALKKYGIGVQATVAGDYKSAIELFTRTNMSDADRKQRTELLNDLWATLLTQIGEARDKKLVEMTALSANGAFFDANDSREVSLIDKIGYLDELIDHLATTHQIAAEGSTFQQIDIHDYAQAVGSELEGNVTTGERIAVVYAEGDIIDGASYPGYIGGDWLASELRRLRNDTEVQAVVLRVNSPGGSAVASEIIQRETRLLALEKPLIVSMGSYAASGGYWISAYAEKIYAQPYTITGSIGVFGLVFNIKDAAESHSVYFDGVKTAPFADLYTLSRPRSEMEMSLIQGFTDEIYGAFVEKVAQGRSLHPTEVHKLARGRVWSGASAQEQSLVDEIGGLADAIDEALRIANTDTYAIEQIPGPSTFAESFALLLEETGAPPLSKASNPIEGITKQLETVTRLSRSLNDPRSVYTRMPHGFEGL